MAYDIFISYSREDTEIVNLIEQELTGYGISFFIDKSDINLGDDFAEIISKSIFECKIMLFVWSEKSNQSENTANEIALAIDFGKTIVPFKIGNFQSHYKLAYRLIRFNRIDTLTYNHDIIIELVKKLALQLGLNVQTPSAGMAASSLPEPTIPDDTVLPPVSETASCILKIRPDTDCMVIVDDEQRGVASANKITRLSLNRGTYWLEFAGTANETDKLIFSEYNLADPEQLLIVELKPVIQKRINQENQKQKEENPVEQKPEQPIEDKHILPDKPLQENDGTDKTPILKEKEDVLQENVEKNSLMESPVENDRQKKPEEEVTGVQPESKSPDFLKGEEYYKEKKYWGALTCYRKAAELGDYDAMIKIGDMYTKGIGVGKDKELASEWYMKARSKQGNANAFYEIGTMYYNGVGVKKDKTEAIKWYTKAAEQNNAEAQYALGLYYDRVWSNDKVKCMEWLLKAAENGHMEAMYKVGNEYKLGITVSKDNDKAIEWFIKVAERGHIEAMFKLWSIYNSGSNKNKAEADKWWEIYNNAKKKQ